MKSSTFESGLRIRPGLTLFRLGGGGGGGFEHPSGKIVITPTPKEL